MPTLHPNDRAIANAIQSWKHEVREGLNDIEAWRENPLEKVWHDPWPHDPPQLPTAYIVAWIMNEYPSLEVKQIQDVHDAIAAWHADHDAERVPAQTVLESIADRAIRNLQVAELAIDRRANEKQSPPPQPLKKSLGHGDWMVPLSKAEIARRTGVSEEKLDALFRPFGGLKKWPDTRQDWTVDLAGLPPNLKKMLLAGK